MFFSFKQRDSASKEQHTLLGVDVDLDGGVSTGVEDLRVKVSGERGRVVDRYSVPGGRGSW